ncbi:MAG: tetratricopeptide repeat protein [Thermoplasmata archaeon]|jgi:tetratricopeptide (TPR) repeat protein
MAEPATGARGRGSGPNPSLESLSPEQHRILAYASAIGSEFRFSLLVGAMGIDEEVLAEELERLVHLGALVERAGGERFAFAEEEFRARIYRSLTESRLRVLHRKIAEVLEKMYPEPPLPVLQELGRHYFLGKVPTKSYEYNRRAAEAARAADEPEVAAHHLERVLLDLASLPGNRRGEQAEVAEALGDLYYALGNFPSADLRFTEALERLGTETPRVRARLLLARAEVARENLDLDTAVQRSTEAQRLFEDVGDRLGSARTHRLLGRVAFQRGAYRESLEECQRALDLIGTEEVEPFLGRLAIDIGNAFALLGPDVRDIATEWYAHGIERLERVGDWIELSRGLHNLGVLTGEVRPQDGLDYLEKAQQAAERGHDTRAMGRALTSSVELLLALGQLEEAERNNEQVARLLEHLSDELGREQVEVNRGQIAERRGQWEDAEHAYEKAVETCRRLQLSGDEAEAMFHLARLRYKTRDLEGARRAYATAVELNLTELRPQHAPAFLELGHQLGLPPPTPVRARPPVATLSPRARDERGL